MLKVATHESVSRQRQYNYLVFLHKILTTDVEPSRQIVEDRETGFYYRVSVSLKDFSVERGLDVSSYDQHIPQTPESAIHTDNDYTCILSANAMVTIEKLQNCVDETTELSKQTFFPLSKSDEDFRIKIANMPLVVGVDLDEDATEKIKQHDFEPLMNRHVYDDQPSDDIENHPEMDKLKGAFIMRGRPFILKPTQLNNAPRVITVFNEKKCQLQTTWHTMDYSNNSRQLFSCLQAGVTEYGLVHDIGIVLPRLCNISTGTNIESESRMLNQSGIDIDVLTGSEDQEDCAISAYVKYTGRGRGSRGRGSRGRGSRGRGQGRSVASTSSSVESMEEEDVIAGSGAGVNRMGQRVPQLVPVLTALGISKSDFYKNVVEPIDSPAVRRIVNGMYAATSKKLQYTNHANNYLRKVMNIEPGRISDVLCGDQGYYRYRKERGFYAILRIFFSNLAYNPLQLPDRTAENTVFRTMDDILLDKFYHGFREYSDKLCDFVTKKCMEKFNKINTHHLMTILTISRKESKDFIYTSISTNWDDHLEELSARQREDTRVKAQAKKKRSKYAQMKYGKNLTGFTVHINMFTELEPSDKISNCPKQKGLKGAQARESIAVTNSITSGMRCIQISDDKEAGRITRQSLLAIQSPTYNAFIVDKLVDHIKTVLGGYFYIEGMSPNCGHGTLMLDNVVIGFVDTTSGHTLEDLWMLLCESREVDGNLLKYVSFSYSLIESTLYIWTFAGRPMQQVLAMDRERGIPKIILSDKCRISCSPPLRDEDGMIIAYPDILRIEDNAGNPVDSDFLFKHGFVYYLDASEKQCSVMAPNHQYVLPGETQAMMVHPGAAMSRLYQHPFLNHLVGARVILVQKIIQSITSYCNENLHPAYDVYVSAPNHAPLVGASIDHPQISRTVYRPPNICSFVSFESLDSNVNDSMSCTDNCGSLRRPVANFEVVTCKLHLIDLPGFLRVEELRAVCQQHADSKMADFLDPFWGIPYIGTRFSKGSQKIAMSICRRGPHGSRNQGSCPPAFTEHTFKNNAQVAAVKFIPPRDIDQLQLKIYFASPQFINHGNKINNSSQKCVTTFPLQPRAVPTNADEVNVCGVTSLGFMTPYQLNGVSTFLRSTLGMWLQDMIRCAVHGVTRFQGPFVESELKNVMTPMPSRVARFRKYCKLVLMKVFVGDRRKMVAEYNSLKNEIPNEQINCTPVRKLPTVLYNALFISLVANGDGKISEERLRSVCTTYATTFEPLVARDRIGNNGCVSRVNPDGSVDRALYISLLPLYLLHFIAGYLQKKQRGQDIGAGSLSSKLAGNNQGGVHIGPPEATLLHANMQPVEDIYSGRDGETLPFCVSCGRHQTRGMKPPNVGSSNRHLLSTCCFCGSENIEYIPFPKDTWHMATEMGGRGMGLRLNFSDQQMDIDRLFNNTRQGRNIGEKMGCDFPFSEK